MASCSAPLEQIHPRPASLDDYVPLLLITHALDPPQLLSVVKFSSPGVFKKKKKMREPSEPLSFNIRPEMSCSGCEGPISGSPPFLLQSRSCATQSRSGLTWRSEELLTAGFVFSTSARSISLIFKNDHESSNTKIDRRAISGFSKSLSFLIKQKSN